MRQASKQRQGAVLPLVVICLVGLMGLLALAIDIGMVAVARSQAQNAADASAMAGARTINGSSDYNYAQVPVNAVAAAISNKVFGQAIAGDPNSMTNPAPDTYLSGQIKVEAGAFSYTYNDADPSKERFEITLPGRPSGEPYSAVRSTVSSTSPLAFGRVFQATPFDVQASAVAIHRPRDVIIIMDLSGSMRFQSLPGIYVSGSTAYPSSSDRCRNKSMNPDPDFPQFGHYSDTTAAALQGSQSYSTGAEWVDLANLTYRTSSGDPIVEDFYKSGTTKAFTRGDAGYATTPGGDDFPKANGNYIKTANEYLNGASDENSLRPWLGNGYGTNFKGYTEGPGYWGKTFFIWPPDPRGSDLDPNNAANHADNGAKDWRQRFFFKYDGTNLNWLDHNNLLFDSTGSPTTTTTENTPVMRDPDDYLSITENGLSKSYRLRINYAAILNWLRTSPVHFPSEMRTGKIKYYGAIPDPSDTTINSRFWNNSSLTNDEKFWKEYIDFMLGYVASGATYSRRNGSNVPYTSLIGNGDFYKWGTTTVQVTARPDCTHWGQINNAGGYAAGVSTIVVDNVKLSSGQTATTPGSGQFVRINYRNTIHKITNVTTASGVSTLTLDKPLAAAVSDNDVVQFYTAVPRYMNHLDNPYRPKHQFWFGAQTFVDWLGNYQTGKFWWPGNVHEAQAWACKVGIQTAIDDIKKNHPSDFVGMAFFSDPRTSASDSSGWHNRAIVPLGRNYDQLKQSLWFPPTTVTGGVSEISCYDSDFYSVPRANGGTAPGMGFMIAYNQLSNSTTLRNYATPSSTYRGNAGGLGRNGANRLVIFETDGAPNTRAYATMGGTGKDAYYKIRIKYPNTISDSTNEFPSGGTYASNEVYNFVKQICAADTASPAGFSNSRKPALVYSLGYGSLFDPSNSSTNQTNGLTFLQTVQYYGNVAKTTSASDFPDWQRIYGTNDQRITRMQAAFTNIMQAGIQVSLIQ